ncbi:MAG: glycosyltransferase family 4 protein, partial [Stackebrandtia sp.]
MKVVVAHNMYSSAQPSGENSVVNNELAQLAEAGVTVVPFLRSSDEIASLSLPKKVALIGSPIYSSATQKSLTALIEAEKPDVLHLHNPYPFLSPAVVRTSQKLGVPVVQTVHNYRQVCMSAMYFRDGHMCHDCRGKSFAMPGIVHGCYRGSRAQSVIMATTLAVNRRTWHGMDRYIALTENVADHLRDYGIDSEQIRVKPNSIPDPGPHEQVGSGFMFLG